MSSPSPDPEQEELQSQPSSPRQAPGEQLEGFEDGPHQQSLPQYNAEERNEHVSVQAQAPGTPGRAHTIPVIDYSSSARASLHSYTSTPPDFLLRTVLSNDSRAARAATTRGLGLWDYFQAATSPQCTSSLTGQVTAEAEESTERAQLSTLDRFLQRGRDYGNSWLPSSSPVQPNRSDRPLSRNLPGSWIESSPREQDTSAQLQPQSPLSEQTLRSDRTANTGDIAPDQTLQPSFGTTLVPDSESRPGPRPLPSFAARYQWEVAADGPGTPPRDVNDPRYTHPRSTLGHDSLNRTNEDRDEEALDDSSHPVAEGFWRSLSDPTGFHEDSQHSPSSNPSYHLPLRRSSLSQRPSTTSTPQPSTNLPQASSTPIARPGADRDQRSAQPVTPLVVRKRPRMPYVSPSATSPKPTWVTSGSESTAVQGTLSADGSESSLIASKAADPASATPGRNTSPRSSVSSLTLHAVNAVSTVPQGTASPEQSTSIPILQSGNARLSTLASADSSGPPASLMIETVVAPDIAIHERSAPPDLSGSTIASQHADTTTAPAEGITTPGGPEEYESGRDSDSMDYDDSDANRNQARPRLRYFEFREILLQGNELAIRGLTGSKLARFQRYVRELNRQQQQHRAEGFGDQSRRAVERSNQVFGMGRQQTLPPAVSRSASDEVRQLVNTSTRRSTSGQVHDRSLCKPPDRAFAEAASVTKPVSPDKVDPESASRHRAIGFQPSPTQQASRRTSGISRLIDEHRAASSSTGEEVLKADDTGAENPDEQGHTLGQSTLPMEPIEDEFNHSPPYRHPPILPTHRTGPLLQRPEDGEGYTLGQSTLPTESFEDEFNVPPPYRHSPILPSYRPGSLLQNPEPGLDDRPGQGVYAVSGRPRSPSMMPSSLSGRPEPRRVGTSGATIETPGFADTAGSPGHNTRLPLRLTVQNYHDRLREATERQRQRREALSPERRRNETMQEVPPSSEPPSDLLRESPKESDLKAQKIKALQDEMDKLKANQLIERSKAKDAPIVHPPIAAPKHKAAIPFRVQRKPLSSPRSSDPRRSTAPSRGVPYWLRMEERLERSGPRTIDQQARAQRRLTELGFYASSPSSSSSPKAPSSDRPSDKLGDEKTEAGAQAARARRTERSRFDSSSSSSSSSSRASSPDRPIEKPGDEKVVSPDPSSPVKEPVVARGDQREGYFARYNEVSRQRSQEHKSPPVAGPEATETAAGKSSSDQASEPNTRPSTTSNPSVSTTSTTTPPVSPRKWALRGVAQLLKASQTPSPTFLSSVTSAFADRPGRRRTSTSKRPPQGAGTPVPSGERDSFDADPDDPATSPTLLEKFTSAFTERLGRKHASTSSTRSQQNVETTVPSGERDSFDAHLDDSSIRTPLDKPLFGSFKGLRTTTSLGGMQRPSGPGSAQASSLPERGRARSASPPPAVARGSASNQEKENSRRSELRREMIRREMIRKQRAQQPEEGIAGRVSPAPALARSPASNQEKGIKERSELRRKMLRKQRAQQPEAGRAGRSRAPASARSSVPNQEMWTDGPQRSDLWLEILGKIRTQQIEEDRARRVSPAPAAARSFASDQEHEHAGSSELRREIRGKQRAQHQIRRQIFKDTEGEDLVYDEDEDSNAHEVAEQGDSSKDKGIPPVEQTARSKKVTKFVPRRLPFSVQDTSPPKLSDKSATSITPGSGRGGLRNIRKTRSSGSPSQANLDSSESSSGIRKLDDSPLLHKSKDSSSGLEESSSLRSRPAEDPVTVTVRELETPFDDISESGAGHVDFVAAARRAGQISFSGPETAVFRPPINIAEEVRVAVEAESTANEQPEALIKPEARENEWSLKNAIEAQRHDSTAVALSTTKRHDSAAVGSDGTGRQDSASATPNTTKRQESTSTPPKSLAGAGRGSTKGSAKTPDQRVRWKDQESEGQAYREHVPIEEAPTPMLLEMRRRESSGYDRRYGSFETRPMPEKVRKSIGWDKDDDEEMYSVSPEAAETELARRMSLAQEKEEEEDRKRAAAQESQTETDRPEQEDLFMSSDPVSAWPSGSFSPWPAIDREVEEPVSPLDVTRRASRHFSPEFNLVATQRPESRHGRSRSPPTSPKSGSQYSRSPTPTGQPRATLQRDRSPSPATPVLQSTTPPLRRSSGNTSAAAAPQAGKPAKSELKMQIPTGENIAPAESPNQDVARKHDHSVEAHEKLHRTQQIWTGSSPNAQTGWIIETGFGVIRSFDGAGFPEHVENIGAQHIEDTGPQHTADLDTSSPSFTPSPHDGQVESRHSSEGDGNSTRLKLRRKHRRSSSICLSSDEAERVAEMARSARSDGSDDRRDAPRSSSSRSKNPAPRHEKLETQSRVKSPGALEDDDPDAMTDDPVIANWHTLTAQNRPSEPQLAQDRRTSEATQAP
ncbi:hypothetical protein MBLNU457_6856t1 [Dothideomycetes sp. NU457]